MPMKQESHYQESNRDNGELSSTNGDDLIDSRNWWSNVPDEILAHVLMFLPIKERLQLRSVNRQWQRCALHYIQQLDIEFFKRSNKHLMQLKVKCNVEETSVLLEKAPMLLAKYQQTSFGHLLFKLMGDFSNEEVFCALAKMAMRAKIVYVKYDTTYNFENFDSFCDTIGPRVTHLQLIGALSRVQMLNLIKGKLCFSLSKLKRLKAFKSRFLPAFYSMLIAQSEELSFEEVGSTFQVNYFPSEVATQLQSSCKQFIDIYQRRIKRLDISQSEAYHGPQEPLNENIKCLVNLKELSIKYENNYDIDQVHRFNLSLSRILQSYHQLSSIHVQWIIRMSDLITMTEIQTETLNFIRAIGICENLHTLSVHFQIQQGSPVRHAPFEEDHTVPFRRRLDIPLLYHFRNGSTIKKFVGSANVLSEDSVSWNIWDRLGEAMPNIEDLTIDCFPGDLKHFCHLKSLKRIVICNLDKRNPLRIFRNVLATLVDTCPSLTSLVVGFIVELTDKLCASFNSAAERQMARHGDFTVSLLKSKDTEEWREKYMKVAPRNLCIQLIHCTKCMQ